MAHPYRLLMVSAVLLAHGRASAQNNSQGAGSIVSQDYAEVVSIAAGRGEERGERAVHSGYWDMGTTLRFSSPVFSSPELNTPHTARLGIDGRFSIGNRVELAAGVALPPKQDEVTADPKLFDGVVMGRYAISNLQSLYVFGSAKRLLQLGGLKDDGVWGDAAAGWNGQSFIDTRKFVAFTWHLGANADRAFFTVRHPWLVEAAAGLGLRGTVMRVFELGAGADFRFPLVSGGRAYWAPDAPVINPQTRVDLYLQASVQFATGWSIGASVIRGDRGDINSPATVLPIVDGGYDQISFVASFSYRGVRQSSPPTVAANK